MRINIFPLSQQKLKRTLIAYRSPPEAFPKQILHKVSFGLTLYENANLVPERQQKKRQLLEISEELIFPSEKN